MAIKKPHLQPSRGQIADRVREVRIDENPALTISFKLLDLHGNPKFSTLHCDDGYVGKLLERLKGLNSLPLNAFRNPVAALRNHPIDFSKTTEPDGFTSLNTQLQESEAWQFQISANQHGRIHGILIESTFYAIWIDPCHLLYSVTGWCKFHKQL